MTTQVGYVQLRRGLTEHILDGRMDGNECAAFSFILMGADFRTGVWNGSGAALASAYKWSLRKAQMVIASLRIKGYLSISRRRGTRGNYPIRVAGYQKVTQQAAPLQPKQPKGTQQAATSQEVKIREEVKKNARDTAARQAAQAMGARKARDVDASAVAHTGAYVMPAMILCNLCRTRVPWTAYADHACPVEMAATG